jgi:hypothetical protein
VIGTAPKFDTINVGGAGRRGRITTSARSTSRRSRATYADLDADGVFDVRGRRAGVTITPRGQSRHRGEPHGDDERERRVFVRGHPADNAAGYMITETQPADYLDGVGHDRHAGRHDEQRLVHRRRPAAGVNGANNNFGEAPNFVLTKTLVSTSEAGTGGSDVAIGEVATFRLVVTIPVGSLTDFSGAGLPACGRM